MDSYKHGLLIQVHLLNADTYSNATYGIVNGVMYVTTGQQNFTFETNEYKAGLVYSYGAIENRVDLLGEIGGYKVFNQFQFTIKDRGLLSTLTTDGIGVNNAPVYVQKYIENDVYDSYYGCVTSPSGTGDKLRVVCGDIANVKEANTPKQVILGDWKKAVTSRFVDISNATTTIIPKYGLIFPDVAGDASQNTKEDYEADKSNYESVVMEIEEPASGNDWKRYLKIASENPFTINTNPNYSSYPNYVDTLKYYNVEVIDSNGETTDIIHTLGEADWDADVQGNMLVLHVVGSVANIEAGKTKVRLAQGITNLKISSDEIENPVIYSHSTQTPAIDLPTSNVIQTSYLTTGTPTIVNSWYSTSDGKIKFPPWIPTTDKYLDPENLKIGYNISGGSGEFLLTDKKESWLASDLNFDLDTVNSTAMCRVTRLANTGGTTTATMQIQFTINKNQLPESAHQLGFSITSFSPIGSGNAYLEISDLEDLNIFRYDDFALRYITTEDKTLDLINNKHIQRDTYVSGRKGVIGMSPFLHNDSAPVVSTTNAHQAMALTSEDIGGFIVDPTVVYNDSDEINIFMTFGLTVDDSAKEAYADFFLNSFFVYEDSAKLLQESLTVNEVKGELWSNDSKYTSGASEDYPVTRTEIARYLLDVYGLYETTDYQNNIFLPIADDAYSVAYDNYDKLDKNVTDLINDVLEGSTFVLTGDVLGRRKMLNIYDLIANPTTATKTIVGSIDQVSTNAYIGGIANSFKLKFDGSLNYQAVYDKDTGNVESSSDVDYDSSSATALEAVLNDSVYFNAPTKVKSFESKYTNFGDPSFVPAELGRVADVFAWVHDKFDITHDAKKHYSEPVYIGDWIEFKDQKYTADSFIYGMVQGFVDSNNGKVKYSCVGICRKPPASILDEQNGGYILNEQIGGSPIDEE